MKSASTFSMRLWLPLLIFAIFAVSIGFSAFFQHQSIEGNLETQSLADARHLLANSAHRIEGLMRLNQRALVADEVADSGVNTRINSLALLDEHGRVLEATRREWMGLPAAEVMPHFDAARFSMVQDYHRPDVAMSLDGRAVLGYQPVTLPPGADEIRSSRVGALVLDYDLALAKSGIWHELLGQRLAIWSVTLWLVLGLLWMLGAKVLRPLDYLTQAVRRFGAGDRNVEVAISGKGELAQLGDAWNQMHRQLVSSLDELAASRENLEVTLFSIGDAVIVTDAHGCVTRMNGVAQTLTGWDQEAAAGLPLNQVFHIVNADTRQLADDPVQRVLETGHVIGLANHTVLMARDGREYQIADSAAPIRDREGRLIGVVLVFRDVTDEYALRRRVEESERLQSIILDTVEALIYIKDTDYRYQYANRRVCELFGMSAEDILGKRDEDFFDAESVVRMRENDRRVIEHGERLSMEGIYTAKQSGISAAYMAVNLPLKHEDGSIYGLCGISTDITARRQAERELQIAATAFDAQEGILVTDANNVILRVNRAFTRLTGYSAEEAVGNTPNMLNSGRQGASFYQAMWDSLSSTHYWQGEIWNRRKNGEIYPEWLTITAVTGDDGKVANYVATFSDITQYKAAEEKIHQLAYYDSLTGLPNRRMLHDRLKQAIAAIGRSNCRGAILFIDLDNFKIINDTRGHDVGDLLLVEVARRLQACVRSEDTVARLGGDEFVVMIDSLSASVEQAVMQAEVVGEKVLQVFAQPFMLKGHEHYATPSIGISLFHDADCTVEELLKRADAAMYQAKHSGRNAIRFFDPAMQAALETRMALEAELRRALPDNQFLLHFQPQVDNDGRVIGAEALLRWRHPERGIISPDQFIPLAEESRLIVPIGKWVLETACRQLKRWQANPATRDLQLAINVSPCQFRQSDFVDQFRQIIQNSQIDASQLKIELTESLVLDDVNESITRMHALKEIGVGFSMDDFGTGYSSLAYLKKLPLDQLKIDQSFVRDIATDPDDAVITRTIVAMAGSLGLSVIAEGVETEEQRTYLQRCGCPAYQGYLFGRPVPIEEFEARFEI